MSDNPNFYVIIYSNRLETTLSVAEISWACEHEMNEYLLASKKQYTDRKEAVKRAKKLAYENGLSFQPDDDDDYLLE